MPLLGEAAGAAAVTSWLKAVPASMQISSPTMGVMAACTRLMDTKPSRSYDLLKSYPLQRRKL